MRDSRHRTVSRLKRVAWPACQAVPAEAPASGRSRGSWGPAGRSAVPRCAGAAPPGPARLSPGGGPPRRAAAVRPAVVAMRGQARRGCPPPLPRHYFFFKGRCTNLKNSDISWVKRLENSAKTTSTETFLGLLGHITAGGLSFHFSQAHVTQWEGCRHYFF